MNGRRVAFQLATMPIFVRKKLFHALAQYIQEKGESPPPLNDQVIVRRPHPLQKKKKFLFIYSSIFIMQREQQACSLAPQRSNHSRIKENKTLLCVRVLHLSTSLKQMCLFKAISCHVLKSNTFASLIQSR